MLKLIQKSISVQATAFVFVWRVEEVRRATDTDFDLLKIFDQFLDAYGSYESI